MGMFDSMYDRQGNEWQVKAFDRVLARWHIGDNIESESPDFQVKVYGGRKNESGYTLATIRDGVLVDVPAPRDPNLPLIDYSGGIIDLGHPEPYWEAL